MNKEQSTRRIMLNLRTLSKYTATPGNGCTRLPFTEDAYDAKEFIRFLMCDAGLKAHDDGAGNIFGVKKGKNSRKGAAHSQQQSLCRPGRS